MDGRMCHILQCLITCHWWHLKFNGPLSYTACRWIQSFLYLFFICYHGWVHSDQMPFFFDCILIKRAYLIGQGAIFNLNDEPLCQVYCQVGSVSGVGDVSHVFSVTSWQFWWIWIGCQCSYCPSRFPESDRNDIACHCISCCGIHLS